MAQRSSAYLETIIAFLLPYFSAAAADLKDARSEIIDTLASYATRTRAEMLQAAYIIALGMTTLDVLAEARTAEMSQSMRLRYRGCANGLNRSTINTENALDRRLACEAATVAALIPEPASDIAVRAAAPARTNSGHPRDRTPGLRTAPPQPTSPEDRDRLLWAGAMIDTLKQMGIPTQASG